MAKGKIRIFVYVNLMTSLILYFRGSLIFFYPECQLQIMGVVMVSSLVFMGHMT